MNFYMRISNDSKRKNHLIQIILGCIICISVLTAVTTVQKYTGEALVVNGEVDLAEADFSNGKQVQLKGGWEYFDKKLIVTEMLQELKPDRIEQIPSYEEKNSWGSYRIRLLNCPPEVEISIPLRGMPSASRVFLNGKSVEKSGIVSSGHSMEITAEFSEDSLLPLRSSTCELVVETSGRFFSGLSVAPVLMWKESYVKQYQWYQAVVFLLLGTNLLFLVAYLLGMLLTLKSGYSPIMFAGLFLLFLQEIALDVVYSVMPGNNMIQYDHVFLTAYLCRMAAWGIFVWREQKLSLKKGRISAFGWVAALIFCIFMPVCCSLTGCTWWWMVSDAVVGFFLLYNSFQIILGSDIDRIIANCGLCFLWTGFFIGDLATSGYAPFLFRTGILAGGALFQLSIYTIDRRRTGRLQEEALKAANLETELEHAKTELALHQIKPHFLHNALMSIKVLCRRNPSEAEEAVYNFSVFLRSNMKSIESENTIPFSEELKTIEAYLSIEQIRFGKKLHVVWDIQEKEFSVPPLTIQPIVENAVRHGICNKPGGGTVKISSYKKEDEVWICVEDDGVGFDVQTLEGNGGIGIKNLRLRLESFLHAKLEIYSKPGEGCRQIVKIPFRSQEVGEYNEDYSGR